MNRAFDHWLWVLPILLVVAFLSIRQIDLYPPSTDELHNSMNRAGWLADSPYSPIEVIEGLHLASPEHLPGFFVLLNLWGKVTPHDLATGRVLGVYFGLLSLAVAFRLGRDFIAPPAGMFTVFIIASCAFNNFYLAHLRMYSLMLMSSGIVLWLYLRIVHELVDVRRTDYGALFAAVALMVCTQATSILFLISIGVYHLLFARKDRRWQEVAIVVAAGVLVLLPLYPDLVTRGVSDTLNIWGVAAANAREAIQLWLIVISNNYVSLLVLALAGLALGVWRQKIILKRFLILPFIFLITLALIAEVTGLVSKVGIRNYLAGIWPFVLIVAAGLYSLFCFRRWLGLLVALWVIAGLSFQATADWAQYLSTGRVTPFSLPAYHAISRLALQDGLQPHIVGLPYHPQQLDHGYSQYTHREFYFTQHGIHLEFLNSVKPEVLENHLRWNARSDSLLWLFFQTSKVDESQVGALDSVVKDLHFRLCDTVEFGVDTVVKRYAWVTLDCETPQPQITSSNRQLDYQFYGAALDEQERRLYFSDKWTAEDRVALDDYWMSYQLIAEDWDNVAQLDLPLVHRDELRIFYIDVSEAPAGSYQLTAILYEKETGTKENWLDNDSNPPEMLRLAEVEIP